MSARAAPPPPGGQAAPRARRRLDPRVALAWARRFTVIGCILGIFYLYGRIDVLRFEVACSPLYRLAPRTLLWIDRRPPRYHPGDLAFFTGGQGELLIGEVREIERHDAGAERLWILTDDPSCPGADSRELGWIPAARMRGRVVFATGAW